MAADGGAARLPPGAPRLLLAFVFLIAAGLRVAALDKPFYIDEMTTITVAAQPLAEMPRVMRLIDASPALYPLLLHGWMQISQADAWVRLLSAIFGWLAVVMTWRLASDTLGWRTGLAAAAVIAIAPAHVHYAQYVRGYSLFTLLAVVHLWLFFHPLGDGRIARWRLGALSVVTAALLYTHYLSVLLFPVEALWAFARWRSRRRQIAAAIGALAAGALLFLPGVPLFSHNVTYDRLRNLERPEPPAIHELVPTLVAEIGAGQRALGFDDPGVQRATLVASAVLLPALALTGVVSRWSTRRDAVLLLALVAVLPVAVYIGSGRRLVAVRFFLPFMTAYAVLAGAGLASLRRGPAMAAGACLVLISVVPLVHFFTRYQWSYDHRGVARAIEAATRPGDALLVVHPFESFYYRWYLGDRMQMEGLVFTVLDADEQPEYVIKPPPLTLDRAQSRVQAAAARYDRFWVVGQTTRSFASDPVVEDRLFDWLDDHYVRVDDLEVLTGGDPRIVLYDARPAAEGAPAE